jgi:chromate transport protein ChrA
MVEATKDAGDLIAVSVTASTFVTSLPPIVTMLTIAWLLIRIWESNTVQKLRKGKDKKHK